MGETEKQPQKKTMVGVVISTSMQKTISILNERLVQHKKYKKYIKRSTKVFAHDENSQAKLGDKVLIEACRPISKKKSWRLLKVLSSTTASQIQEEKSES